MNQRTYLNRNAFPHRRLAAGLAAVLACLCLLFTDAAAAEPLAVILDLHASPDAALPGQTVSLQVQASAVSSALIPTGSVLIQSDQGLSCLAALDASGKGGCPLVFAAPGRVVLQAVYQGSTPFLPAVSEKLLLPITSLDFAPVLLENFENTPGPEWSDQTTSRAPNGEYFLGMFGNQTVTLSLTGLPAHGWVEASFDLYVIGSWDGSLEQIDETPAETVSLQIQALARGPDHWQFKSDGAAILDTTFSNWSYFLQAFPGKFGTHLYPPQTGALDINLLGFDYFDIPKDATYRLRYRIIHSGPDLELSFTAFNLQALDDESWGIDNLAVLVSSAAANPLYLPLISH